MVSGRALSDAARIVDHEDRFADLAVPLALIGVRMAKEGVGQPRETEPLTVQAIAFDEVEMPIADVYDDQIRAGAALESSGMRKPGGALAEGGAGGSDKSPGQGPAAHPSPASLANRGKMICALIKPESRRERPVPAYRSIRRTALDRRDGGVWQPAAEIEHAATSLADLVRHKRPGREPDLAWVLDRIARGEPVQDVPPLPVPSTSDAVTVLIDTELAMSPAGRDVDLIVDALIDVVGDSSLEILRFLPGPPTRCGSGPIWTWENIEELRPASAVLLAVTGRAHDDDLLSAVSRIESTCSQTECSLGVVSLGYSWPKSNTGYKVWVIED